MTVWTPLILSEDLPPRIPVSAYNVMTHNIYRGDLDAGVNTVSNLTSLIKSIDSCADIVAELAGAFTN